VRIVDVQEEVRAKLRLRTRAQNSGLNVVKIHGGAMAYFLASVNFD